MNVWDIAIIGAGASGLAAAVEASSLGASVIVLEKNHVPGRKILSTGAGKCNFSNEHIGISDYHGGDGFEKLLTSAFAALPSSEIIGFFEKNGLLWRRGENGKLFPVSMKAQDVADVLCNAARRNGAEIRILTKAETIRKVVKDGKKLFSINTQSVPPQWDKKARPAPSETIYARNLIVATGSPCYPQIGGTDSGYSLLRGLGHSITDIMPAIVPFRTTERIARDIDGVRTDAEILFCHDTDLCRELKNSVSDNKKLENVVSNNKNTENVAENNNFNSENGIIAHKYGEIIFAKGCVSGPAVLDCSRAVQNALKTAPVYAVMDFFPDYSEAAFSAMLQCRRDTMGGDVSFSDFMTGMHNGKLLSAAATLCGISPAAKLHAVREQTLASFGRMLKFWPFRIAESAGFEAAVVAAGGVPLSEINPATFESRIVPGLYIAGECLDIDGRSGGFNLHFAWTSGILAARNAVAN